MIRRRGNNNQGSRYEQLDDEGNPISPSKNQPSIGVPVAAEGPPGSPSKPPTAADAPPKKLELRRIFAQAYPERCLLIAATIMLILSSLSNLAIPQYIGIIVDTISKADGTAESRQDKLNWDIIQLAVIIGVGAVTTTLRGWWFTLAGERVVARLRRKLFEALIIQEIGLFDVTRTGEIVSRLSSDTTILKDAATVNISMLLRFVSTILGGLIYLFFTSWLLTLVMLAVVPVVVISAACYGRSIRHVAKDVQDALAKATEVAEETFGNIRTVKSFSKENFQADRYGERVDRTYALGRKAAALFGSFFGVIIVLGFGAIIFVLWFGATLVIEGRMTPGTLTSFLLYTVTIAGALGGMSGVYANFMQAVGANERVFNFLDRKPAIDVRGGDQLEEAVLKGRIEFENVNFAYPSRDDVRVLEDFSLTFEPSKVTALVGPSGGGKSTVVSLIERFYDPLSGRITFDGHDLRSLDQSWLHSQVALVNQEPVLFALSIKENISYGNPKVTMDQIIEAAKLANAHSFISGFPDGYDTVVGERGVRLSGGQKQRVAIARALILDPKVLLLDEATSALDAESEHLVQEALERLMKGRTVIVVAHRLSTIRDADLVAVVNKGKLAESGTHQELLKRSGVYAALVKRQLENNEMAPH